MGKRSNFKRRARDRYDTPWAGIEPFAKHMKGGKYVEPCAGAMALVGPLLKNKIRLAAAYDIKPRSAGVVKLDALKLTKKHMKGAKRIITNPPWDRKLLHAMIEHFRTLADETWLLLDADWAHTLQAAPYMKYCALVVSVGRLKWIPGTKMTGKENCAWYLFLRKPCKTIFIGREINESNRRNKA